MSSSPNETWKAGAISNGNDMASYDHLSVPLFLFAFTMKSNDPFGL